MVNYNWFWFVTKFDYFWSYNNLQMKPLIFVYVFVFGCLFSLSGKQQPNAKDCVKHLQIIKTTSVSVQEKNKVVTPEKFVKSNKNINSIPHFSVFNFINFFYTKDTSDNLQVM